MTQSPVTVFGGQTGNGESVNTFRWHLLTDRLNLSWNWLFQSRFCRPSVGFSISKRADTDPAARLLDGWQEGVVPLVLQKALWTEAEAEASVSTEQSRARLQPSSLYKQQTTILIFYLILHLITLFRCNFFPQLRISLHFDGIPTWLPQREPPSLPLVFSFQNGRLAPY